MKMSEIILDDRKISFTQCSQSTHYKMDKNIEQSLSLIVVYPTKHVAFWTTF